MSGEYLAQSKHQISANRLHKMSACELAFAGGLFYGNSAGNHLYQDTR